MLSGLSLSNTILPSISQLSFLQHLQMDSNYFSETIPTQAFCCDFAYSVGSFVKRLLKTHPAATLHPRQPSEPHPWFKSNGWKHSSTTLSSHSPCVGISGKWSNGRPDPTESLLTDKDYILVAREQPPHWKPAPVSDQDLRSLQRHLGQHSIYRGPEPQTVWINC